MTVIDPLAESGSLPKRNDPLAAKHPRHRLWQLHIDSAKRFLQSGQQRKARQKLRAALREATHFGENDERLAITLMNLVASEVELNDGELNNAEALALANQAVRVNKCCYGSCTEEAARSLLNAGVLLEHHKLFDEANAALEEAVQILRGQKEQTQAVAKLLYHTLYNRAALLWTRQKIAIDPAEVLKLADEAYTLGTSLYGSEDRLVVIIKELIDDIKHDQNISGHAPFDDDDWSDDDDAELSKSGSHIALPEGSIASQLAAAGERLPESLQKSLVARGHDIVPELITILENDDLAMRDAPGGGIVPIHAVELLAALGATESAESMLQVLSRCDWFDLLHEALRQALASFGDAVLEPALRSYVAAENQDHREAVAAVLADIGIRDQRVFSILLAVLLENVELGANLLADYGDPAGLPHLYEALDACRFESEGGMVANQDIIEIASAIVALGGILTESQENLLTSVHRAGDAWRKTIRSQRVPVR